MYQSLYVTEFIITEFFIAEFIHNKVYNQSSPPSILYVYKYVISLHVWKSCVFLHSNMTLTTYEQYMKNKNLCLDCLKYSVVRF
jgi:hypothetical protein